MSSNLTNDLESLSKKLYLEDPDLWMEFLGKIDTKIFDEMVIFFAVKYNYFSIVKYALENKTVDLNSPSKNKSFSTIRQHIASVAKQYNRDDILDYLSNPHAKIEEIKNQEQETKEYIPSCLCTVCNKNLFEFGYKITANSEYKYSKTEKKLVPTNTEILDSVTCCSCNSILKEISPSKLENLCNIQVCGNCGKNLTNVGLVDKMKMKYDQQSNKFIQDSASYYCGKCESELNEYQKEYFGL